MLEHLYAAVGEDASPLARLSRGLAVLYFPRTYESLSSVETLNALPSSTEALAKLQHMPNLCRATQVVEVHVLHVPNRLQHGRGHAGGRTSTLPFWGASKLCTWGDVVAEPDLSARASGFLFKCFSLGYSSKLRTRLSSKKSQQQGYDTYLSKCVRSWKDNSRAL